MCLLSPQVANTPEVKVIESSVLLSISTVFEINMIKNVAASQLTSPSAQKLIGQCPTCAGALSCRQTVFEKPPIPLVRTLSRRGWRPIDEGFEQIGLVVAISEAMTNPPFKKQDKVQSGLNLKLTVDCKAISDRIQETSGRREKAQSADV